MSGKLTHIAAKNAKPGRHADGGGLYLLVKPSGARYWLLRVQVAGRRRDIGLASFSDMTLAEARIMAAALRKVARHGGDAIAERDRDRKPIPTFKDATIACHAEMTRGWTPKHAAAFLASLTEHAFPTLGKLQVDSIVSSTIRDALAPIWVDKPAISRKVRQRIGTVLNFANSKGWRASEAPTKSVSVGLSRQPKGKHFKAMPHHDLPAFIAEVEGQPTTFGRLALLFTIYTAARSGEVRFARWEQIDLESKLWKRPASIMKSREAHEVTLSDQAVAVLKVAAELRTTVNPDALIFSPNGKTPLSDMTITKVMRDAKRTETVHGFRSTFRDWAAEKMPMIPDAVVEAAMAHVEPDATVRAYKRTQFIEMRHQLLAAWGRYAAGFDANVVQLRLGARDLNAIRPSSVHNRL